MEVPRSKLIDRVRKLNRLSLSSNQHEAERAKEEAAAIMRKYGITKDDIAEAVTREADATRDAYREFLAVLAAKFFNCMMVGKKNAIGFRGMPRDVQRALSFYDAAIRESEGSTMPPVARHLKEAALDVWKFCWWDAFVAALYERFGRPIGDPKRAVKIVDAKPDPGAATDNPLSDAIEAATMLSNHLDVHWLKFEAKRAGRAAGHRIEFPTVVDDDQRALPALVKELP